MSECNQNFVVVIDGPAASGKSTTAKKVAQQLGWIYLDTGAMYRAMAVKTVQKGIALDDTQSISEIAESVQLNLEVEKDGNHVFVDGEDVTHLIRTPEIDKAVGPVCEVPKIREVMVAQQRKIAEGHCIVAEGRDMGTVVFPNADLKYYMEASIKARAERRLKDMKARSVDITLEELEADIERRDKRDSSRAHSPLKPADDAIHLDTTLLTIDEQSKLILVDIENKLGV